MALGKSLLENCIRELQAQLDALQADVHAKFEVLEEDEDAPECRL